MVEVLIHTINLALALAAAVESVRLIRLTGRNHAWLYISAGLILLSVKRLIEMYVTEAGWGLDSFEDMLVDMLGLLMTVLFLVGIYRMRAVFAQHLATAAALREELDDLRRFERLTVGRELRMKELSDENSALQQQLGAVQAGGGHGQAPA